MSPYDVNVESERYRQWEKDYEHWYNKYYKDFKEYKDYAEHSPMHHKGRGSRDRERDRMSPLARDYSPQERSRKGTHRPASSSTVTKPSKVVKVKKVKKKRTGDEADTTDQDIDQGGDATPVRDEPMDDLPHMAKTPPMASKSVPGKAAASKSPAMSGKMPAKSLVKTDKIKKEKVLKAKVKVKPDGTKVKVDKLKKKPGEVVKKKEPSTAVKTLKAKPKMEEGANSSTPKKDKAKPVSKPALPKTPPQAQPPTTSHAHLHENLRMREVHESHRMRDGLHESHRTRDDFHESHRAREVHESHRMRDDIHESHRQSHDVRGRREAPQSEGPPPLMGHHRGPSPMDRGRRVVEEGRSLLGPPPGKLRRIEGPGIGREAPLHPSHQPALHRVVLPADRPLSVTVSRDYGREERQEPRARPLMDLQIEVKPTRRIKLNREVTRRGAADTPPSGPDRNTSSGPLSGGGDRHSSESSLRREPSPPGERRERPSSAGDMGHDRGGPERDRDRGYERVRARSSQRTAEREAEGERPARGEHKTEHKSSIGSRSVSLDKMTIGEKTAKRQTDHQDKPSVTQKPREQKSDRSVSKDGADRAVSSGEKPAAAHREGKDGQEAPVKTKPRISRKVLTSHSGTSARPKAESKRAVDKEQKPPSSKPVEPSPPPPEEQQERSPSVSPAQSPTQPQEPLIQAPPRSKWEDDEESQEDNDPNALQEPSPPTHRPTQRSIIREAPPKAAKEIRKTRPKKDEGKAVKTVHGDSEKTTKSKIVREDSKGAKDEQRREERTTETRAPEPRRQRLCSDLTRETDEAAFVPDYSEGEGSEPERGRSLGSASPSLSQPTRSPSLDDSGNEETGGTEKKKKKHKHKDKSHKRHKKHKKHSRHKEDGEHREHRHKHKKKKSKKSKDKDVEDKPGQEEGEQVQEEEQVEEAAEQEQEEEEEVKAGEDL